MPPEHASCPPDILLFPAIHRTRLHPPGPRVVSPRGRDPALPPPGTDLADALPDVDPSEPRRGLRRRPAEDQAEAAIALDGMLRDPRTNDRGRGTTIDRHTPTSTSGFDSITDLAAAYYGTMVSRPDGTV